MFTTGPAYLSQYLCITTINVLSSSFAPLSLMYVHVLTNTCSTRFTLYKSLLTVSLFIGVNSCRVLTTLHSQLEDVPSYLDLYCYNLIGLVYLVTSGGRGWVDY